MHETNAEFGPREEENIFDFWIIGVVVIILGAIAILYYLRYVLIWPNIQSQIRTIARKCASVQN